MKNTQLDRPTPETDASAEEVGIGHFIGQSQHIKTMNEEQINIAIAEACGWEWSSNGWGHRFLAAPGERSFGPDESSPLCEDAYTSVPNYCNDLNAMHEAEKVLESPDLYGERLESLCNGKSYLFHTTARQRAEAFLWTIGKSKEAAKCAPKTERDSAFRL